MKRKAVYKQITEHIAMIGIVIFLLAVCIFFFAVGERAQIAVQDNLDLFQAQYRMLQNTHSFFGKETAAPFLHGISRNTLPSALQLPGLLYVFFPAYTAYILALLFKIAIGTLSMVLLAETLLGEETVVRYRNATLFAAFAYGLISFFPAFGIAFASIPLAVHFFIRLYRENGKACGKYLAALLLYPFVSYLSYFGMVLIGYFVLASVCLMVKDRRFHGKLLLGCVLLFAGYLCFEHRLFAQILLQNEPTIRETMVIASLSAREIAGMVFEGFAEGMFHAHSMQKYFVMPVVFIWVLLRLLTGWKKGDVIRKRCGEIGKWALITIVFNSLIYGLYYWKPLRDLVELLLPPLKGWQFNRTMFFNAFLWYLVFLAAAIDLCRMAGDGARDRRVTAGACAMAALFVLLLPARYNDLRNTGRSLVYEWVRGKKADELNYGEFYSTDLFDEIKEEIGYRGEWALAYGMHPAVLEYNGIATLDGYLGFYSQAYKEEFRKIIAPALERMPATKAYYDDWGARCYLYSGTEDSVVQAVRRYPADTYDHTLYVDADAIRALDGKYLFSRIPVENTEELGFTLRGTYENAVYQIYVYAIES